MSQIADFFWQPFSSGALKLLPKRDVGIRAKSKRADRIPDDPQRPLVTDYHSINNPTMRVRVPKKTPTPVKVEAKVWFANERTFISYLSMGLLLSTIASGLLFGSRDSPARWFAFAYALISAGVLVYGWAIFQKRLTMISARDSGNFDLLWGPIFICLALFIAILANFIFRLHEAKKHTGVNPLSFTYAWNEAGTKSS
ncbi:hypothetical protein I305_05673 [Cryptococcus gattii E566]|uniref:Vacuole fusion, non-autophagic-related protein, putative n=2 Tax=Cryptococcus gattii TaxID=37769 RepID=E6R980_CRYGW|nr:Vacuole fusion, non-autophagic-related protein, putative [Cryptococcus gattii WM276]ADV23420.1 Vacuole fusion, non-autophagic-related protein, putative [Cryptococcus gattii WM276]KIR77952.1 hypothetical protein I306_05191 [Cryptococcus gattii EJB2]KIY32034.1 hypothetical protein I305_05673 [Cryptococcus gattii E566]KJE00112.1 hypothetical protein I311_06305 [Cryptococcus gattii NT-10]